MNVNVIPNFQREAKKLIKKYRSLKSELLDLVTQIKENPRLGTLIKENIYKIRLAVKSKGKGKIGRMRVITFVEMELFNKADSIDVYLLSIYDKSDRTNISNIQLTKLVEEIKVELEQSFEEE